MMTIDEAILHAKESARENRYRATHRSFHKNDKDEINACIRCAEEHEQLAEWLAELKFLKSEPIDCGSDVGKAYIYNLGRENGYSKAVDDFVETSMKQFTDFDLKHGYPSVTGCKEILRDVSEMLKGGGADAGSI